MRGYLSKALVASLAALNFANGLPLEPSETESTEELIPFGTPVPVFADRFEDLNVFKDPISLPLDDGGVTLSCIDCFATAGVVVNVTLEDGSNGNDSLVTVAFYNTQAHIELSLIAQGSGKAFFPIWTSVPPGSGDIIGYGVEVGIALEIQADIDVRTGFTTKIADGTFFNYSPSSGFLDTNLAEGDSMFEVIPLHVESGSAIFKAALQARIVLRGDLDTDVFDASGEAGAYINLPELVYDLHSSDTCGLEVTYFAGISVGVWADGDVSVGSDDDDVDQDDGFALDATPFVIGDTETNCLVGGPTSFMVGGAPPITSEMPTAPISFRVSGAPPPTLSATPTEVKVSEQVSTTTASGPLATGSLGALSSESGHSSFKSWVNSTVTAPPSGYTSTVYTTQVRTVAKCDAYSSICPSRSSQPVTVSEVGEPRPSSLESVKVSATKHTKVITPTRDSYQETITPSVVPVTAGALGHKEIDGYGCFLAIAMCLAIL